MVLGVGCSKQALGLGIQERSLRSRKQDSRDPAPRHGVFKCNKAVDAMPEPWTTAWNDVLADREESAGVYEAACERPARAELFALTKTCLVGSKVLAEEEAEAFDEDRSVGAFDEDPADDDGQEPKLSLRRSPFLPGARTCARGHSGERRGTRASRGAGASESLGSPPHCLRTRAQ